MGRTTVYNDNLTSNWNDVSKENQHLVSDFLKYLKANNKSPQTIHQYESWLKVFFCWNQKENGDKFFIDLKKRDFVYYFGYLRDLGMSDNRIASLKSGLSSLSNEIELLYEDEYPNFRNQIRSLEPIHISAVREKTVMSTEQINEMLTKLVEDEQYQLACYIALVCSSGARKAELLQMKVDFFTEKNVVFDDYMYCTPPIRSKGRGKKGKIIKKYVIKEMFDPYLKLWLEQRQELGITSEYLFVTKRKGEWIPADISAANTFARQISTKFGIDFYSHSGRHYFCTLLKSMHLPDDVITLIFSWESSTMIPIYNDVTDEEILNDFFSQKKIKDLKGE